MRYAILIAVLFVCALVAGPRVAAAEAAFVGMQIQGVSPAVADALGLAEPKGVLVRDVALHGPSARAGFERGDLIVRFNDVPVESFEGLVALVGKLQAGASVPVTVVRGGQPVELQLDTGKWPDGWRVTKGGFAAIPEIGLTVASITEKVRGTFDIRWGSIGIVASIVEPETPSAKVLRRGEVIHQINQVNVWRPNQFMSEVTKAKAAGKDAVLLLVEGNAGFRFTLLPLK